MQTSEKFYNSGAPNVAAEAAIETIEWLHNERYSCRAFRSDPVPATTLNRILRLAQRTATWCNTQPWQVYITEGEGTRRFSEGLHAYAASSVPSQPDIPWPREYRGVYLQRRRDAGFRLYQALGIARGDREGRARQLLENYRLFGAPHAALITSDEALGCYGALDCGGYVANFLLAARACGVDACAQAAIAHCSPYVRQFLGLGSDRSVVCGIAFGYADLEHPANRLRLGRASVDDAVSWIRA